MKWFYSFLLVLFLFGTEARAQKCDLDQILIDLQDAKLSKAFIEKSELVESWKVFKDANLSDAIRKNPANLEALSKAMKQNGYNAAYFENLLKSKTDPQKFIDDYVSKLGTDGMFIDNTLEMEYASYVSRKARQGKPPRDRADWNEASYYMKYNSPTARGNKFNKKAELEYDINELNLVLDDGSFVRIDTYVPALQSPTGQGMIISRKATDLVDIDESVFRKHLQEMKNKYAPGTEIRSNAYPILNGKKIEGKQYLQIPESNTTFYDIERYKKIAQDEYGIEIIFLAE
jgi:hypothetical protein